MQKVQPKLAVPVQKYLEAIEPELKNQLGVSPEEALSDVREHLQNEFDAMNRAEPGQDDAAVFDEFVERFGSPAEVAASFGKQEDPVPPLLPGRAQSWRIFCTFCGRSAPAGRAGITRIGAFSAKKYTLGFCRNCRWLRFLRIQKDLEKNNLSQSLGARKTPKGTRGILGSLLIQKLLASMLVFAAFAALFGLFTPAKEKLPDIFQKLPEGWTVQKSATVNERQRSGIADRLGVPITSLANTIVAFNRQTLQINTLTAATNSDAEKLEAKLRNGKTVRQLVLRSGRTVYELVARNNRDLRLALAARLELGIQPREVRYKISFNAAPLETCDYMQWNKLFNLYLKKRKAPTANVDDLIAAMSRNFQFSDQLALSRYGIGAVETKQSFSQQPVTSNVDTLDGRNTFQFNNQTAQPDIGNLRIKLSVTSRSGGASPEHRNPGQRQHLLQPTNRWPVSDSEIQTMAKKIIDSAANEQDKVNAILEWLTPGVNVRFGGDVTGARYGVRKFLDQKFGHCWDFSDAFITFCRAAGVPSRQVYGWLHQSSGHVWAEVLIPGEGWKHVDPTAATGCGSDYIPITSSEDGEIPLLYTSEMEIEVVSTSNDL